MSTLNTALAVKSLSLFAALQFLASTSHANESNADVIGSWKIVAVLDSSEIAALTDEQARRLIGKTLTISSDKLEFAGRVCKKPDFDRTQEEPVKYFRESAHASAAKLGLPTPVTVVHVSCTYVYPKFPDELVVHWKGFFFNAMRLRK
jgi:hypothetical protein